MFLAIVFIILGSFLLLDALGIIVAGHFWGLFWAILFLALGFRMLAKRGKCPVCTGAWWGGKFHETIHGGCCGHNQSDKKQD